MEPTEPSPPPAVSIKSKQRALKVEQNSTVQDRRPQYDLSNPLPRVRNAMKDSDLRFPVVQGRMRSGFFFPFLFLFHVIVFNPHLLRGQTVTPAVGGRAIHGIVKSGNMPIPGAGVSATNAATKEQVNTSTDVDGSYSLKIPADGHYIV